MNAPYTAVRSQPLDALRGLAILGMVFSGRIPFGVLPDWMYHAQVPPPIHKFIPELPGITWVDLVFPYFLFAMGAAIPLALKTRLDLQESIWKISASVLKRGALLAFFAMYVMHIRPTEMAEQPGVWQWLLSLIGFVLLFPMLARMPGEWSQHKKWLIRSAGWAGALVVLYLFQAKDGSGFSVKRSDIIILVLANVAIGGSFAWIFTRKHLDWRIGILAFLFALRLTESIPGWGQWLWNISPAAWLGKIYFQQYLFIVIPGTIAGELLIQYSRAEKPIVDARLWVVAAAGIALTLIILVGLKGRWVIETTALAAVVCIAIWMMLKNMDSEAGKLLRALIGWGIFWLMLGLAFEPYENGIHKDHPTMSYYFVTSGLAFFSLVTLIIAIDFRGFKRGFGLLIKTGQNPLVAYAGENSLLPAALALTGVGPLVAKFTTLPWVGVIREAVYTLLLAKVGASLAARKVFLRM